MHPWNILLFWLQRLCRFCQHQCQGHNVSPDNRSSDILFLRYDLIRRKPENERSASAELTGRLQPAIISKTRMLGYISSSAYFTHSIRFPGSCKVDVYCFQKFYHCFNSERSEDSVGKSSCQNCSFSAKLPRLSCFTNADGTKKKISAPPLLSSLNLELISSNK